MSATPPSMSRDEIRRIDRIAIETLGIPGVILMENAGRLCADAIERFLGGCRGKALAVVAGAGNNGGDGFVIARHLAMRGARVATYLVVPRDKVSGDAAVNLRILEQLGHEVYHAAERVGELSAELRGYDVLVDAIGGTGIRGALRGTLATAVEQTNAAVRPIVAVDIPTGLDCDTGEPLGPTIRAAMTVTMVARKKGFDAPGASACTGEVVVADIGIPPDRVLAAAPAT